MKMKRILSLLLAALMMIGTFAMIASAAEDTPKYVFKTSPSTKTYDYIKKGNGMTTADAKIKKMDLRVQQYGFQLYVDEYSGEVAVKNMETGDTLFSNPYDVGYVNTTDIEKAKMLSQLSIKFKDVSADAEKTYYSANKNILGGKIDDSAMGNDLVVSYIKNGIRVEYSIGTEESRMLLPVWIERSKFDALCETMDENGFKENVNKLGAKEALSAFYFLRDPATGGNDAMYNNYPITKEGVAIYTLANTSTRNKRLLEGYVKTYAPDYTYEDMDADHAEVKYEDNEIAPPLFKLALEYTLDENGLSVRLPANGIRFDETHYQLEGIDMLPYMGAGDSDNEGYTFFPDGSGAIFDFQECKTYGKNVQISGKVYGQDYAYHTISGTNQQVVRYPVYGIVEAQSFSVVNGKVSETDKLSETDASKVTETYTKDRGFVAVIEEGASLVSLMLQHTKTSGKNTIKATVTPRPKDSYNLGDSVSIAANATYSVTSNRKYTGSYKIRYIMLTDADVAAEKGLDNTYPCTYYGMAQAYREYLEKNEVLTSLTNETIADEEKLPLYIEALGALETTEKILSIPVEVMTPLVTFADVQTIYNDLSAEGIDNINFILNGFTKGGLTSPATPYRLKWEKAVEEGGVEFDELVEYAREKGFGVYPDIDFVFIHSNTLFDGLSLIKHASRTIDNRYASLQEYNATKQTYISYYDLIFSAAYMSKFYEKFTDTYLKEDPMGISVSTLGSYLSSDFDEDDPYNRDDSEQYVKTAFEYLDQNYGKVMTAGGNAYSWKYVDYITDIATDSSRYSRSAAAVPFLGIVLHGYVEISGTAINMEGNLDYAMLKAIESGSALKFILAYRNSNNLKNDFKLNKYYSIDYSVWAPDIISLYNEINDALSDVQTSKIVKHEFVNGATRVPDADELERDAQAAAAAAVEAEKLANIAATEAERLALLNARRLTLQYSGMIEDGSLEKLFNTEFATKYAELLNVYNTAYDALEADIDADLVTAWKDADEALAAAEEEFGEDSDEYKAAQKALEVATTDIRDFFNENKEVNKKYKEAKTAKSDAVKAINALIGEEAYGFYDEYIMLLRDFSAFAEKAAEYKEIINACSLAEEYKNELVAKIDMIIAASALYEGVEEVKLAELTALYEIAKAEFEDEFKVETYTAPEEVIDDAPEAEKVVADDRYAADKNKVVYEEFENGKAFLLNFNNYKVIVSLDGVTYTIDAYGYLIVSEAK